MTLHISNKPKKQNISENEEINRFPLQYKYQQKNIQTKYKRLPKKRILSHHSEPYKGKKRVSGYACTKESPLNRNIPYKRHSQNFTSNQGKSKIHRHREISINYNSDKKMYHVNTDKEISVKKKDKDTNTNNHIPDTRMDKETSDTNKDKLIPDMKDKEISDIEKNKKRSNVTKKNKKNHSMNRAKGKPDKNRYAEISGINRDKGERKKKKKKNGDEEILDMKMVKKIADINIAKETYGLKKHKKMVQQQILQKNRQTKSNKIEKNIDNNDSNKMIDFVEKTQDGVNEEGKSEEKAVMVNNLKIKNGKSKNGKSINSIKDSLEILGEKKRHLRKMKFVKNVEPTKIMALKEKRLHKRNDSDDTRKSQRKIKFAPVQQYRTFNSNDLPNKFVEQKTERVAYQSCSEESDTSDINYCTEISPKSSHDDNYIKHIRNNEIYKKITPRITKFFDTYKPIDLDTKINDRYKQIIPYTSFNHDTYRQRNSDSKFNRSYMKIASYENRNYRGITYKETNSDSNINDSYWKTAPYNTNNDNEYNDILNHIRSDSKFNRLYKKIAPHITNHEDTYKDINSGINIDGFRNITSYETNNDYEYETIKQISSEMTPSDIKSNIRNTIRETRNPRKAYRKGKSSQKDRRSKKDKNGTSKFSMLSFLIGK